MNPEKANRPIICVNRCSSVALISLLRSPHRVCFCRETFLDPEVSLRELKTFCVIERARPLCYEIGIDNAVKFQRMLQARNTLLDLLAALRKLTSLTEPLECAHVHRHQSFVAGITSSPGSLPFARHRISGSRYDPYRQLVVKQVTIPVLARTAEKTVLEFENLEHQHCIADVDSKLALVFEMRRAFRVVAEHSTRR